MASPGMSTLSETARSSSGSRTVRSSRWRSNSSTSPPDSDAPASARATTSPCASAFRVACTLSATDSSPWNARPCRRPTVTFSPEELTDNAGRSAVPFRRAERLIVPALCGGRMPDFERRSSGSCVMAISALSGRSGTARR